MSDEIPPQMKILNMVIPILMNNKHVPFKKTVKMYFVVPKRQWLPAALNRLPAAYIHLSTNEKRRYAKMSDLQQYIAGYTVVNL